MNTVRTATGYVPGSAATTTPFNYVQRINKKAFLMIREGFVECNVADKKTGRPLKRDRILTSTPGPGVDHRTSAVTCAQAGSTSTTTRPPTGQPSIKRCASTS